MLVVKRIINTPVPSNCFVVYDKTESTNCIIVDPGTKDNVELLAFISSNELIPQYIILTHEHFDHCWGVNCLAEKYRIPIICSRICSEAIRFEKRNCSVFYDINERFVILSPTISIESLNNKLLFADKEVLFFETPGHSDASICFTIGNGLFTGDTLIKGNRTVTKLPSGSNLKLKESLAKIINYKGQGLIVYPGHGDLFELDNYNLESTF